MAASLGLGRSASGAPSRFIMPPGEALHELTFMQWPSSRRVYRDAGFLEIVQNTIADIANTVAAFEPVAMLAASDQHAEARRKLSGSVELWDIPTEDLWCRDAGPIFVVSNEGDLAIAGIQFNGWGEKQVHRDDSQIARRVAARLGVPVIDAGLFGEGGGVEQDGHGLLMAHESSWVHDGRNPDLTRDQIEARLLSALGADRMIWSPGVWDEDITDYHIDSLARFTGPGRVLINLPARQDPSDPFHLAGRETHDALLQAGLTVDVIDEPSRVRIQAYDFVASYVNYYVCNGAVIAAQFGDAEADANAVKALQRHYPERELITLDVDPLGELGGGIHCATQQMPAV
ncbi:MAG: agmatine deiminase family protein [Pseudomonadota bacterium]